MSISVTALSNAAINASGYILAQAPAETPAGPDFGKASPVGLLLLVAMGVIILALGYAFHRRQSRFRRRALFAQQHGIDPFDANAIDQAMAEAGVLDRGKKRFI